MFYEIVHGIAPNYPQELLLPFYRPTRSYNLRNADQLNFVMTETRPVSYYYSFLSSDIQLWKGLPLETKCIESFHILNNVLKKPVVGRS